MKWIKQFAIIITIQMISEVLVQVLSIPLPGTVFGMGILLILLIFKVVKLKDIEGVGDFLLSILIMLYIPSAIGIIDHLDTVLPLFIPIFIVIVLSTMITLVVTGHAVQFLIGLRRRKLND